MSTTQHSLSQHAEETQAETDAEHTTGDDESRERCESVNPSTGRRCTNTASRNGLCALCRHAVTVVRASDVPFDPIENPTPFSELETSPGGDA